MQTDKAPRENYPAILQDLFDKVTDLARDHGVDAAAADEATWQLTEHLRLHWSGRNLYVLARELQDRPAKGEGEASLFDAAPAESPAGTARPHAISLERLQDLGSKFGDFLTGCGVDAGLSGRCAAALVDFLRRDWLTGEDGKRHVYIPKGRKYELNLRDYEIWRQLKSPEDVPLLMQKHGLTLQRVYQINRTMQRRHMKREQPPLPGIDKAGNE